MADPETTQPETPAEKAKGLLLMVGFACLAGVLTVVGVVLQNATSTCPLDLSVSGVAECGGDMVGQEIGDLLMEMGVIGLLIVGVGAVMMLGQRAKKRRMREL